MIGSEKAQTWIRQLWKAYVTLWRQMKKIKFSIWLLELIGWERLLKGDTIFPFYLFANFQKKNWLGIVLNKTRIKNNEKNIWDCWPN
jgi:hypothetical protein